MAEIPSWMWIVSGTLITVFSIFLGYIRPVDHYVFFRFMIFVGLIMLAFGGIKFMLSRKTKQDLIDEMRKRHMQRGGGEVELRQNTGYPQGYTQQPRTYTQQNQYNNQVQAAHPQHHRQNITHPNQHYSYNNPQSHNAHHAHNPQAHQGQVARQTHPQHHNVPSQQTRPVANSRFCGNCGTPLLKEHKFCPMCGGRV